MGTLLFHTHIIKSLRGVVLLGQQYSKEKSTWRCVWRDYDSASTTLTHRATASFMLTVFFLTYIMHKHCNIDKLQTPHLNIQHVYMWIIGIRNADNAPQRVESMKHRALVRAEQMSLWCIVNEQDFWKIQKDPEWISHFLLPLGSLAASSPSPFSTTPNQLSLNSSSLKKK